MIERRTVPFVTWSIIAACIAIWLAQRGDPALTGELVLTRNAGEIEPWRYVSAGFAHASFMHIAMNMLNVYFLGGVIESLIGHTRFAILYLASLLGGSFVFVAVEPVAGAIGASGAVYGLMAASLVFGALYARESVPMMLAFCAFGAWTSMSAGIAWQAHLGGFITGLVVACLIAFEMRMRRCSEAH